MPYFTAIEEVLNYQKTLLEAAPTTSEFNHIGLADDELFFEYPALILTGEPVVTEIHATHQFKNTFRVGIFVYHAQLSESRTTRTAYDMALVTKVKAVLNGDRNMGGGVVFGFVDSIVPGTIRRPGNEFAIGSRLSWVGEALEAF